MYDPALQDFLDRFGDPDPNKFMTQNQKPPLPINPLRKEVQPISELKSEGLTSMIKSPEDMLQSNATEAMAGVDVGGATKGPGFGSVASMALDKGLQAAPSVMGLISNAKGGQFDTSVEGGGPGKAGGAILQGTMQGKQLADSLGLKDPISQGVAMLGGGLISTFAHAGAQREYKKNVVEKNLKEDTLERAKHEEEFAQSQGLLSMQNLKKLRERQLGILS